MNKYPFTILENGNSRVNFVVSFVPQQSLKEHLVLLDCWAFKNQVKCEVSEFPITDTRIWKEWNYPCIFSEREQWMKNLVMYAHQENLPAKSNAALLQDYTLFHGVGRYMTSEILNLLWVGKKIAPWDLINTESIEFMARAFLCIADKTTIWFKHFSPGEPSEKYLKKYFYNTLKVFRKRRKFNHLYLEFAQIHTSGGSSVHMETPLFIPSQSIRYLLDLKANTGSQ